MVPALFNTFRPSARLGLISLFTDVVSLSNLLVNNTMLMPVEMLQTTNSGCAEVMTVRVSASMW